MSAVLAGGICLLGDVDPTSSASDDLVGTLLYLRVKRHLLESVVLEWV